MLWKLDFDQYARKGSKVHLDIQSDKALASVELSLVGRVPDSFRFNVVVIVFDRVSVFFKSLNVTFATT